MGLSGSLVLAAGLSDYLPILLMGVLAVVFAVTSLGASALLRPHRPNKPKLSAYESGNDPVRLPGGERFSVKFYVVAMLFIIFDIETIFLFPWAVTFRQLGLFGLIEMAVFIALVFVAYLVADTSSHVLRRLFDRDRPPVSNPDPEPRNRPACLDFRQPNSLLVTKC